MIAQKEKPLVSVIMITYNQEKFVEKAVRSVMSQRTAFPFELIIADDASTDGTPDICRGLAAEFPDNIKLIARTENLGASGNYLDAWSRCSGKYIAICEGDDWWLTSDKLSRQVDYMESHPDCTVCFHRVANYYPAKHNWSLCGKPAKYDFGLTELAQGNIITNLSVMYRALPRTDIPEWVKQTPLFDYAMHSLHAARGQVHFDPSVMAAYRKHSYGIWSGDALRARRLATQIRRLLIAHFYKTHPQATAVWLRKYFENAVALGASLKKQGDSQELDKIIAEIAETTAKYGDAISLEKISRAIDAYTPPRESASSRTKRYVFRTLTRILPVSLATKLG